LGVLKFKGQTRHGLAHDKELGHLDLVRLDRAALHDRVDATDDASNIDKGLFRDAALKKFPVSGCEERKVPTWRQI